jgi:hypothetical protein
MLHHGRFSMFPVVLILIALTLSLALASCDSPTAPGPTADNGLGGAGAIDPGVTGAFLLGEVSDTSIGPGTLEVWAMNVAFDDTAGIVTFDVQILNLTARTIAPPIRFVITSITPHDVSVVDFDGVSPDGFPFYDFSAKLGNDNVLTPRERTGRVTMKFHTVTARSFAIGFRIDIGPAVDLGTIGGVVFNDTNENGLRDRECRCENGIPGITVALERMLENGDRVLLLTRTDENGEYRFAGNKEGVHKVFVHAPENLWRITSANPLLVTLVKDADGKVQDFLAAHFGLFPLQPPPAGDLFGPIPVGPASPFGTEVDSTFVNPPSPLTVVFNYYVEIDLPVDPATGVIPGIIDSAEAWINGEPVFQYVRPFPPDSAGIAPQTIKIRDGLVIEGTNTIRLTTYGDGYAAIMWRVYKQP